MNSDWYMGLTGAEHLTLCILRQLILSFKQTLFKLFSVTATSGPNLALPFMLYIICCVAGVSRGVLSAGTGAPFYSY